MIIKKDDEKFSREQKMEKAKTKMSEKYAKKVESKLFVETKAMQDKKRTKFDPEKDDRSDAMTMGGYLPGQGVRANPSWRAGI